MNKNYEEFEEIVKHEHRDVSLTDIVDKVKSKWSYLSEENKQNIWNYLIIFVSLSDKIKQLH
jgi:hypothetical protein